MNIHNKRVIRVKHAHFGHERTVSDNDIISTQDSIDLIIWRRFPSDQQPGLIQLHGDISRKHWRHWEGQENKGGEGWRTMGWNPETYTQPQRKSNGAFPLKSLFTVWCALASGHSENCPAKQSPMVKEGRKFRGAPPLKMFFQSFLLDLSGGGKNAELKWMRHFCDEDLSE